MLLRLRCQSTKSFRQSHMKSGDLWRSRAKIIALSFKEPSDCVKSPKDLASKLATLPGSIGGVHFLGLKIGKYIQLFYELLFTFLRGELKNERNYKIYVYIYR